MNDLSFEKLENNKEFIQRHIGPDETQAQEMLRDLGLKTIDELIDKTVPKSIRTQKKLNISPAQSEYQTIQELKKLATENKIHSTYIGQGFHDTVTPSVIARNVFENPGWYTSYTPYQPEISQGRLEALLNFQTMCADLTGMDIANASLLDEGSAAAEAMVLCRNQVRDKNKKTFFISSGCHPHVIDVVQTRAQYLEVDIQVGDVKSADFSQCFGVLLSYPNTDGSIEDLTELIEQIKSSKALAVVTVDILSLAILKPPGEMGADIAVGNTQRLGVPLGLGGPHAAFIATKDALKRKLPGRLVGVSIDNHGRKAYRLALQTREQHIRREKATSNICTAQALLANMASFYGVYHGPKGLQRIAQRVHCLAATLYKHLEEMGFTIASPHFFDTVYIETDKSDFLFNKAQEKKINLKKWQNGLGISINETTTQEDILNLLEVFSQNDLDENFSLNIQLDQTPKVLQRISTFMQHPVFNSYHSETSLMRYIKSLEDKDLSLNRAMIPLGSCTMKLNAATELIPVSWPKFNKIHPFVPFEQINGYLKLIKETEEMLATITGFAQVSIQPNAGSQGEFAGLLAIRHYQKGNGQGSRNVCLIPSSAHGTNPASAVMSGLKVVVVQCRDNGNIDLEDLKEKAKQHKDELSCLMITYPSTHGVYEEDIKEICDVIHNNGGQVYMDGANMNALVGLSRLPELGADVCHLNLHKTFAIPHGGGGPGVGPVGVAEHLRDFLPNHQTVPEVGPKKGVGAITSAPWGSASILPISWSYMKMLGREGLKKSTEYAVLNANYIAEKLKGDYDILYKGQNDMVAHECIIDVRPFKDSAQVTVDDIAKRLIDYGFHAPTMSWPVAGTLMIEPTESEDKKELDRFIDAMISIREEIRQIENGQVDQDSNVLKNAPHTIEDLLKGDWSQSYSREQAAYPNLSLRDNKYWPPVSRVDNAHGDRNLVCSCPSIEDYQ